METLDDRKRPPEVGAKIAEAKRGQKLKNSAETRAKVGAWHRGKRRSPETCAKISAALRGKMSAIMRGKKKTPEHIAKVRAARITYFERRTPEEKARQSEVTRAAMTPEVRAKAWVTRRANTAQLGPQKISPEHAAKISIALTGKKKSPEHRWPTGRRRETLARRCAVIAPGVRKRRQRGLARNAGSNRLSTLPSA